MICWSAEAYPAFACPVGAPEISAAMISGGGRRGVLPGGTALVDAMWRSNDHFYIGLSKRGGQKERNTSFEEQA